jgi:cell division protein FtsI (penicillin-binding protein 3)
LKPRIVLVGTLLLGAFGLMILRVGKLTILDRPELASRAQRQYVERIRTVESRGEILDREGVVLATTIAVPSIFASPRQHPIGAPERNALAAALQLPLDRLARQLDKDRGFVWLARGVSEEVADDVAALGLAGVGQVREGRRLYPHRNLAAHVIGTADRDLRGVEGIEKRYDRWMRGEELVFRVERDGLGRLLFSRGIEDGLELPAAAVEEDGLPAAPRATLSLSIDATLQSIVERELALGVQNAQADAGVAIMLDPWTGAVLALANVPTYDPNQPGPNDTRRNRALTDRFEPGSTFKAFLAAAAVEEQTLSADERIDCENGRYRIGRWTIHDHHPYGLLSLPDVIKHSSNIGVSKIAARIGRDRFGDYVSRFGFGHKTGIDLPGEVDGTVRPFGRWAEIDLATCSFGQGIAVTPIQLTAAFAAIANGGRLVTPYLLERAVSPSNDVLFEREEAEQAASAQPVVSRSSADAVVQMLERVVEEQGGTGGKARVAGVSIAGKTGTAQKVANGRYSKERLASFIGFAPSRDPAFVLLVMIDNPRKATYGGVVAAPVFSQISAQALDRLGRRPVSAGEQALPVKAGVRTAAAAAARPVAALDATAPMEPQEVATGPAFATEPTIAPTEALPSFIGLSLRAARRRAAVEGLSLMVRGSGFVKSQDPAPGTRRGDAPVVLVLEPSI